MLKSKTKEELLKELQELEEMRGAYNAGLEDAIEYLQLLNKLAHQEKE